MKGKTSDPIIQQICREPTCKQPFVNNGRNAQTVKEFCTSSCCSKYWSRCIKKEKRFSCRLE